MVKLAIQILCLAWLLTVTVSWLRSLLLNSNRFTLKHFILSFPSEDIYLHSRNQAHPLLRRCETNCCATRTWHRACYVLCGWIKCFKNKRVVLQEIAVEHLSHFKGFIWIISPSMTKYTWWCLFSSSVSLLGLLLIMPVVLGLHWISYLFHDAQEAFGGNLSTHDLDGLEVLSTQSKQCVHQLSSYCSSVSCFGYAPIWCWLLF